VGLNGRITGRQPSLGDFSVADAHNSFSSISFVRSFNFRVSKKWEFVELFAVRVGLFCVCVRFL
jgi:hypothetical protein